MEISILYACVAMHMHVLHVCIYVHFSRFPRLGCASYVESILGVVNNASSSSHVLAWFIDS